MTHHSPLHEYLDVLRRRRWIVLTSVVVSTAIAIGLSMVQKPSYLASAEVLLGRQSLANSLSNVTDPLSIDPARLIETQVNIAETPQVAAAVLKAAHLKDRTPGAFLAASSAAPKGNADVMVFSVEDRSPQLASRLATLYAERYISYANALATHAIRTARAEIESKMAQLEFARDTSGPVYANLSQTDQQLVTMETLQTGNASLLRASEERETSRRRSETPCWGSSWGSCSVSDSRSSATIWTVVSTPRVRCRIGSGCRSWPGCRNHRGTSAAATTS